MVAQLKLMIPDVEAECSVGRSLMCKHNHIAIVRGDVLTVCRPGLADETGSVKHALTGALLINVLGMSVFGFIASCP